MTEILLFLISVFLIGFLMYRETLYKQQTRDILAAKLSENASDFKRAIERPEQEEDEEEAEDEIPLEDMDANEFLEVIKK